ncbi:MAG TPA: phage Gp37/Gp68 family protein [Solirubrobacterales bacterium]|nr:phage Gp37/Gp68 family protein [Solirubrobacterales bacterium]
MADHSSIEWTDASWNPWRGCDKVSPGCAHCYMFRDQARYGRDPSTVVRAADPTFMAPARSRKWQEQRLAIEVDEGRRMRVFTCSWSDFFHPDADEWRDEAWALIAACPQYDWQILTKRPELIADRLPDDWGEGYENVWLGVSIENRRFVDRADLLRATPAAVRFISAEPLLGPLINECPVCHGGGHCTYCAGLPGLDLAGIDWLIVGGESGSRHRPMHEEWALQLLDASGAPDGDPAFFFKQWGGPRPTSGGRELDGRTWSEFPSAAIDHETKGQAHV